MEWIKRVGKRKRNSFNGINHFYDLEVLNYDCKIPLQYRNSIYILSHHCQFNSFSKIADITMTRVREYTIHESYYRVHKNNKSHLIIFQCNIFYNSYSLQRIGYYVSDIRKYFSGIYVNIFVTQICRYFEAFIILRAFHFSRHTVLSNKI